MARTVAEQREYQRGYNRALQRCRDRVARALRIAKAYRDGSRISPELSCVNCERWARGPGNCLWGTCRADFEYEVGESKMWAVRFVGEKEERPIITQENFGCINWIQKPPS